MLILLIIISKYLIHIDIYIYIYIYCYYGSNVPLKQYTYTHILYNLYIYIIPYNNVDVNNCTGVNSYREHGYRLLLIWYRGCRSGCVRLLFEALVSIGRQPLAEKTRREANQLLLRARSNSHPSGHHAQQQNTSCLIM